MISKSTILLWALLNIYILSFIYLTYFFQSLCLYYYYALTVIKCTNKFNTAPFINHSTSQLHLIPFSIISVYLLISLHLLFHIYVQPEDDTNIIIMSKSSHSKNHVLSVSIWTEREEKLTHQDMKCWIWRSRITFLTPWWFYLLSLSL